MEGMKANSWLTIALLLVGILVGALSLYTASLSGVMGKMGMVGGDFGQAIDHNELARQMRSLGREADCQIWKVAQGVPAYLVSQGEERIVLAGQMGGERIVCGVKYVQSGNVERGVYSLIKGLYYLKNHYTEMRVLIEGDREQCQLIGDPDYEQYVEGYLAASEGRVYDVVLELYKQVEGARARVEELCID